MRFSLASSLASDDIELLDLFLEKNTKLSNAFSKQKIKKLRGFLFESLPKLSQFVDIFDDIFILECCGKELGNGKIYQRTNSISDAFRIG